MNLMPSSSSISSPLREGGEIHGNPAKVFLFEIRKDH
jgi:hypothetical protein